MPESAATPECATPECATGERKARIKEFLSRFFRNHELKEDEDIFALGFVNSLLAMQLVNFVEKEFSVAIEDADLDLDNFRTIDNIDALIARKSAPDKSTPDKSTAGASA